MLVEVEAKRFQCGRMARMLRRDHADVLAETSRSIHRQLVDAFDASIIRRAWYFDGALVALGGMVGTLADSEGIIWMALSEEMSRMHPIAVSRGAARFVRECSRTRSLSTDILKADKTSYQFALHLGFTTSGKSMIDGIETLQMIKTTRKAA